MSQQTPPELRRLFYRRGMGYQWINYDPAGQDAPYIYQGTAYPLDRIQAVLGGEVIPNRLFKSTKTGELVWLPVNMARRRAFLEERWFDLETLKTAFSLHEFSQPASLPRQEVRGSTYRHNQAGRTV